MGRHFEIVSRNYAVEVDRSSFLDLLDSESHATNSAAYQIGAQTLADKMGSVPGISDVEYNGHFGAAIYFTIDDENDTDVTRTSIANIIESHLYWCRKLPKVDHVKKRRASLSTPDGGKNG